MAKVTTFDLGDRVVVCEEAEVVVSGETGVAQMPEEAYDISLSGLDVRLG